MRTERIDRAAWKRIKARMAEPRTDNLPPYLNELLQFADGNRLEASGPRAVSFFKGRSVGPTYATLEGLDVDDWADLAGEPHIAVDETDDEFRKRVLRRFQMPRSRGALTDDP